MISIRSIQLCVAAAVIVTLIHGVGIATAQDAPCNNCADLGRTAAAFQLKATEAEQVAQQAPYLKTEADHLEQTALSTLRASDAALDHSRKYDALYRDALEFAMRTKRPEDIAHANAYARQRDEAKDEFYKLEARAKADRMKAEELQAKANSAKKVAEDLAKEAAKAWQAYHDCLKKAKCSDPSKPKTITGIGNCKEAQEWLDRANELQRLADRDREFARQARASGDKKAAEGFESQAKSEESMARSREQQAAYALQKCPQPALTGNSTVITDGGNGALAGAIPLPHESEIVTKMTIKNDCKTAGAFRVETTGLPEGMIQTAETLRVDTESSREFPVTFNSKGLAPGLYRGTIAVVCLNCDHLCPQQKKTFPIQLLVRAQ